MRENGGAAADKENGNNKDLKKTFKKIVKSRNASKEAIKSSLEQLNPSVKELLDAVKVFAEAQKSSSSAFQELIKDVVSMLQEEYKREGISDDRRKMVYEEITNLLLLAQQEARENRRFYMILFFGLVVGTVTVVGKVMKEHQKEIVDQGIQKLMGR